MIIHRRKILFWFFVLIFILLSFITIVYSRGYKIDFSWPINYKSLRKTGQLSIKTNPKGASIYINGNAYQPLWKKYFSKQKEKTITSPQKIKNLFPGEYDITLKLDNYHDLRKKIKINSGKITILDNLELFKNNPPLKMNDIYFSKKNVSPNKEFIIYPQEQYILKLNGNNALKLETTGENVKWSKNSKYFTIDNTFFSIDNLLKSKYDLSELIGTEIKDIQINEDKEIIYYKYNNSIYSFDLLKKEDTKILSDNNIKNYIIKNDIIFIISNKNQKSTLMIYDIKSKQMVKTVTLPYSDQYAFTIPNNNFVNIYNTKYKVLYVINFDFPIFPIQEIINNVKHFEWVNNNKLIYANDFEIWDFDLTTNKKKIITRISNKIKGISIHKQTQNIIYWTNSDIILLKHNNKNRINITNLTHINEISDLFIAKDGKNIYFNGKIGEQTGTYRLNIK